VIVVSNNDTSHFTGTTEVGKETAEKASLQTTAGNLQGWFRHDVTCSFVPDRSRSDWKSSVADSWQPCTELYMGWQ